MERERERECGWDEMQRRLERPPHKISGQLGGRCPEIFSCPANTTAAWA